MKYIFIYLVGIPMLFVAWYVCFYAAMGAMWLLIYGAVYWVPVFLGGWLLLMIGKYGYEFLRG